MTRFAAVCILAVFAITIEAAFRVERGVGCPKMFASFNGKVKYRRKGLRADFKCKKQMRLHGSNKLNCLEDGTWDGEQPVCIGSGCVPYDTGSQPRLNTKDRYSDGSLMQFSCTGNYHLVGAEEAFCNGFEFSAPLPSCVAPDDLMDCDFENGLCGWTQDKKDDHDWTTNVGPTSSAGTGPMFDHTFMAHQNGHYLYFESSAPTMANDVARLLSPVYTPKFSPMCFNFWYHMQGPPETGHVGRLEAFIKGVDEDLKDLQPVFVKEGNQGEDWHKADFFIDTRTDSYQIVIVGTRLLSYISDIAIDDLMLYNCTLLSTPTTTTSTMSTPSTSETPETPASTKVSRKPPTRKPPVTKAPKPTQPVVTKASIVTTTTVATKAPTINIEHQSPRIYTTASTVTVVVHTSTTLRPEVPTHETTNAAEAVQRTNTTSMTKKLSTDSITEEIATTPMDTNETGVTKVITESINASVSSISSVFTTVIPSLDKNNTSSSRTMLNVSTVTSTFKFLNETTAPEKPVLTDSTPLATSTINNTVNMTDEPSLTTEKNNTSRNASITTDSITTAIETTPQPKAAPTTIKTFTGEAQSYTARISASEATVQPQRTEATTKVPSSNSTTIRSPSPTIASTKPTQSQTNPKTTTTPTTRSNLSTKTESALAQTTPTVKQSIVKDDSQSTPEIPVSSTPKLSTKKTITNESTSAASANDTRVSATEERHEHPQDETLKPLMIGLGVGILVGLMIIGVIAWVCVRRRKFYTSRFEDELKPITNSASLQSLNNGQFYVEEYHDLEDHESES
ncbi:zonadhesin-like isoform X2 [Dreissena polymorpha]|uniref:zonadhesin-like isoform X2 n=1 Tax=Dreissena polymorpha TaxID=45954 RepID=UPI002263E2C7|nr:zonadhesin-like isoform X2 [Dreissena polymorpha]